MVRKSKYTEEYLSPFVRESKNWTDLLVNLGLKISVCPNCHSLTKTFGAKSKKK